MTPEIPEARDRVSFITWALQRHRDKDSPRNEIWQRQEAELVQQLERATRELQRLEQQTG